LSLAAAQSYNSRGVLLILASNSPRRQELLRNAGFEFEVRPCAEAEEEPRPGEVPAEFARRAAREKALQVARSCPPGSLVLGADTVVWVGRQVLGKPRGPHEATRMLRLLSGHTHEVITGVCLVRAPDQIQALSHETTFVTFRQLDESEIRRYVETREPLDKAGGYAIQGWASRFVTRLSGCYFNVVGLPVPLVYEMLKPFLKPAKTSP
jgi:septum formation protein